MTNTTHLDNVLGRQKRYLRSDLFHVGFVVAALMPLFAGIL